MTAPPKMWDVAALARRLAAGKEDGQAIKDALDLLSAIDAAGYALVPREPTSAMLKAGAKAGEVTGPTAYKMWRAMLGAAE